MFAKLKSIEIKGYKSINKVQLDFNPINIFIGANGSGKSNLLSFFKFLYQLYKRNLQQYVELEGGADKVLFNGSKTTQTIFAEINFYLGIYNFEIKQGNDYFVFVQEQMQSSGLSRKTKDIVSNTSEANVSLQSHIKYDAYHAFLSRLDKYHFHDTSKNSPFNQYSHVDNDAYFLYEDGRNIAAFLYHIQQTNPISYRFIVKTIQSVAPYFSDFYFHPNTNNQVRLNWQSKYSSTVYGATDLSDGTMRFIALCVLFLQPTPPPIIIIDEPELGLHPFAIAKLAGMIQSAAAKQSQVIVATQSTDLISLFVPEDIITVDQINGESQFKRLNSESLAMWLDDYTLGDLWKRNIIQGGQPNA